MQEDKAATDMPLSASASVLLWLFIIALLIFILLAELLPMSKAINSIENMQPCAQKESR